MENRTTQTITNMRGQETTPRTHEGYKKERLRDSKGPGWSLLVLNIVITCACSSNLVLRLVLLTWRITIVASIAISATCGSPFVIVLSIIIIATRRVPRSTLRLSRLVISSRISRSISIIRVHVGAVIC